MSKIDSGWALRSDEHISNIILNFLSKKFQSTIFAVRQLLRLFKGPLKSLSNCRTAKMVDRNFFDKKFKIMLKMCSSDLKAHPESILDIWSSSWTYFWMVEVMSFLVLFSFPPTTAHLRKLSVFGKTQKSFLPHYRAKIVVTYSPHCNLSFSHISHQKKLLAFLWKIEGVYVTFVWDFHVCDDFSQTYSVLK